MAGWRPPQWKQAMPQTVFIVFPGLGTPPQYSNNSSSNVTLPQDITFYVFDAVILEEHQQRVETTDHPVQTGASFSDHAYVVPARLVLDIGMSDAMQPYFNPSTWQGSTSKSVSAYQTMLAMLFARVPLTVTTRLRTYTSMVVESLTPQESARTFSGLRMRVEFKQIFMATIVSTATSARPQDSSTTNLGQLSAAPPTAAQIAQNNISGLSDPAVPSPAVGAGSWCSVNTDNLASLPGPK